MPESMRFFASLRMTNAGVRRVIGQPPTPLLLKGGIALYRKQMTIFAGIVIILWSLSRTSIGEQIRTPGRGNSATVNNHSAITSEYLFFILRFSIHYGGTQVLKPEIRISNSKQIRILDLFRASDLTFGYKTPLCILWSNPE